MGAAEVGRELGDAGGPLLVGALAAAITLTPGDCFPDPPLEVEAGAQSPERISDHGCDGVMAGQHEVDQPVASFLLMTIRHCYECRCSARASGLVLNIRVARYQRARSAEGAPMSASAGRGEEKRGMPWLSCDRGAKLSVQVWASDRELAKLLRSGVITA
jgi:hypothetical protein